MISWISCTNSSDSTLTAGLPIFSIFSALSVTNLPRVICDNGQYPIVPPLSVVPSSTVFWTKPNCLPSFGNVLTMTVSALDPTPCTSNAGDSSHISSVSSSMIHCSVFFRVLFISSAGLRSTAIVVCIFSAVYGTYLTGTYPSSCAWLLLYTATAFPISSEHAAKIFANSSSYANHRMCPVSFLLLDPTLLNLPKDLS